MFRRNTISTHITVHEPPLPGKVVYIYPCGLIMYCITNVQMFDEDQVYLHGM